MIIKGYRVQQDDQKADSFFEAGSDWLNARKEAIELVISLKSLQHSYQNIRLSLEYTLDENPDETLNHQILTGDKMPTGVILKALNDEHDILRKAKKEFDVMITKTDEQEFHAINQHFIKLYYFTAS